MVGRHERIGQEGDGVEGSCSTANHHEEVEEAEEMLHSGTRPFSSPSSVSGFRWLTSIPPDSDNHNK